MKHFWEICGTETTTNIAEFVKDMCFTYFGVKLGDQDKARALHKVY
jgi:hypothetical protein